MGHWNYRIVKEKIEPVKGSGKTRDHYYLAEVYYNKNGEAWGRTKDPTTFGDDLADSEEEAREGIVQALERALESAKNKPIFEDPEVWAKDDNQLEGTIKVKDKDGNEKEFYCPHCNCIITVVTEHNTDEIPEGEEWFDKWLEGGRKYYMCYECLKEVEIPEGLEVVENDD